MGVWNTSSLVTIFGGVSPRGILISRTIFAATLHFLKFFRNYYSEKWLLYGKHVDDDGEKHDLCSFPPIGAEIPPGTLFHLEARSGCRKRLVPTFLNWEFTLRKVQVKNNKCYMEKSLSSTFNCRLMIFQFWVIFSAKNLGFPGLWPYRKVQISFSAVSNRTRG